MRYSIVIPALFAASSIAVPAVKYVTDVKVVQVTVTAGTPQATQGASYHQAPAPQGAYKVAEAPKPAGRHKHHSHGHGQHSKKPQQAPPVVKTVYEAAPPAAAYTPKPAPPAQTYEPKPAPPVQTYEPKPAPQPTAEKPAPAPSAPSSSEGDKPSSDSESLLKIFNKYRQRYGMKDATWSQSLADNAYLTGQGGNGVEQKHILPELTKPGSCAQVITPGANKKMDGYGDYAPFDVAMLSWLCEKSTDGQIQAECPQVVKANGMTFVDTAHHDDLVNPEYNQVGIAFFPNPNPTENTPWNGLWVASLQS